MTEQAPQPEHSPDLEPTAERDAAWDREWDGEWDGEWGAEPDREPEPSSATGFPAVDEVIAEVDALDERPLDEHLATFERAHERLRAALDSDPGDPSGRPGTDGASGPA